MGLDLDSANDALNDIEEAWTTKVAAMAREVIDNGVTDDNIDMIDNMRREIEYLEYTSEKLMEGMGRTEEFRKRFMEFIQYQEQQGE